MNRQGSWRLTRRTYLFLGSGRPWDPAMQMVREEAPEPRDVWDVYEAVKLGSRPLSMNRNLNDKT